MVGTSKFISGKELGIFLFSKLMSKGNPLTCNNRPFLINIT